jgi:glycosyltransferase involved in cell wall biosynthesis
VQPLEVIVVDDASGDDTAARVSELGARVVTRSESGGTGVARNDGVAVATGEWIAFLDSDDEWLPDHLATLWSQRGDHVIVGGSAITFGNPRTWMLGTPRRRAEVVRSPGRLVFPVNSFVASAVLVKRDAFEAAGSFRDGLRYSEDLDMWIRVLQEGTGLLLPDVTCRYHLHEGQKSRDSAAEIAAQKGFFVHYQDQPWMSSALLEARDAAHAWDDMQAARGRRDWAEFGARAGWVLRRPARLESVLRLLVVRWRLRRRLGQWQRAHGARRSLA